MPMPAGLRWSFFPLSSRRSLSSFFIKIFILHSPRVFSKKNIIATDSDLLLLEGIPLGWAPRASVDSACKRGSLAFSHSFYLSFILSAGEGEGGSVIWSKSDLAQ